MKLILIIILVLIIVLYACPTVPSSVPYNVPASSDDFCNHPQDVCSGAGVASAGSYALCWCSQCYFCRFRK